MRRFVTSNLQLGRPSAIEIYNRPFDNVDEMTEGLIERWNSVVKDGDLVYHLGNFAWDPKTAQHAMSKLKGTIWFIPGEYDDAIIELAGKGMLINGAKVERQIMPLHKMKSTISYWPLGKWPGANEDYWSIIGYPDKAFKSDPKQKTINASTDLWGLKPQNLEHIIGIFQDL